MGTREVSPRSEHGDWATALRALRSRWRTASLTSGFPFPSDWAVAEVDLVCEVVHAGADPGPALARLGRARAEAGSGLGETLLDVAALHAVLTMPGGGDGIVSADPDATPARLLRVAALGWADVVVRQLARSEVSDGLTGLSSPAYLRARLREVYREAAAAGQHPESKYALVVVAPELGHTTGWSRLAAMVLLADVLRTVFDGGQTLATLSASTVVALAERDNRLAGRLVAVQGLAAERLGVDPELRIAAVPPVWLEGLPDTHEAACRLLADLARA